MKKVGIISYPRIEDGKGRFLQAYCLYSAIQNLGYDVEIYNYHPEEWVKRRTIVDKVWTFVRNPNIWTYFMTIKRRFFALQKGGTSRKGVEKYKEYIRNKNIKYEYNQIISKTELRDCLCDAWVCGSDQIWNSNFATGKDDTYYLQFAKKNKRISYAASMGTLKVEPKQLEQQIQWIREIPYVSAREKDTCEMLVKYNIKATHVCDPTFLMKCDWWDELAGERIVNDKYLLLFLFDNNPLPRRVAETIARTNGLKIICISDYPEDSRKYEILQGLGPKEFVSLFKYADYICTQSFHGTVLSLLFNRQFQVFDRSEKGELRGLILRIESLLKDVGLQSRIRIKEENYQDVEIDYTIVNALISEMRTNGLSFLCSSILKAIEEE